MKIKLLCILYLLISFGVYSQTLNKKIADLSKSEPLKNGQWGVYAEYTDNGKEIISFNSDYALAPASGLKIYTTSVSLSILGENYRYETRLFYDGDIDINGVLNGNIYIIGSGDPTLGSELVEGSSSLDELMTTWCNAVKGKKIKKINGSVIADDLLFEEQHVPDYWPWIDIGNYYGAGTSSLTINDNLYYLYFEPGNTVGSPAKVLHTEPEIPGLKFINYMKTGAKGSGDNGYIYRAPGSYTAKLRGTIPAGVKEFSIKGSMLDPALFAVQYFTSFLENNGVQVTNPPAKLAVPLVYDNTKLIHTTISPPLEDIVYIVNKRSNNLYTEQLLQTIGLKKYGRASTENGIKAIEDYLKSKNISIDGLNLYDGCGLSRTNTVTAKMTAKLLSAVTSENFFDAFYYSLGIAGDPADISYYKSFGDNTVIAKNARVKSGLITGVRSHSGYVKNKAGRLIAYSCIANNFSGRTSQINQIHEKVLILLAGTD